MKVENLAAKRFFIKCAEETFDLRPATGIVELPEGASKAYLYALAKAGKVKIHEDLDDVEDAVIVEKEDPLALLKAEYEALAGKPADGRWSEDKLKEKIAELSQPDDEEETE